MANWRQTTLASAITTCGIASLGAGLYLLRLRMPFRAYTAFFTGVGLCVISRRMFRRSRNCFRTEIGIITTLPVGYQPPEIAQIDFEELPEMQDMPDDLQDDMEIPHQNLQFPQVPDQDQQPVQDVNPLQDNDPVNDPAHDAPIGQDNVAPAEGPDFPPLQDVNQNDPGQVPSLPDMGIILNAQNGEPPRIEEIVFEELQEMPPEEDMPGDDSDDSDDSDDDDDDPQDNSEMPDHQPVQNVNPVQDNNPVNESVQAHDPPVGQDNAAPAESPNFPPLPDVNQNGSEQQAPSLPDIGIILNSQNGEQPTQIAEIACKEFQEMPPVEDVPRDCNDDEEDDFQDSAEMPDQDQHSVENVNPIQDNNPANESVQAHDPPVGQDKVAPAESPNFLPLQDINQNGSGQQVPSLPDMGIILNSQNGEQPPQIAENAFEELQEIPPVEDMPGGGSDHDDDLQDNVEMPDQNQQPVQDVNPVQDNNPVNEPVPAHYPPVGQDNVAPAEDSNFPPLQNVNQNDSGQQTPSLPDIGIILNSQNGEQPTQIAEIACKEFQEMTPVEDMTEDCSDNDF